MSKNRKLAAILFADIAGYTAMMQSDEGKTMHKLRHYQAVLKSEVAQHKGEIIKNYGDGSLCLFPSVLDAVHCAKALQVTFKSEPVVPLRIGLHLGDVMYEQNDIYGNDLNIASRIESLGIAGSVLLSKNVLDKVKNQAELKFTSLGTFEFKNVEEPMEVFALANEGFVLPRREELKGKVKEETTSSKIRYWMIGAALVFLIVLLFYQFGFRTDNNNKQENTASPYQNSIVVLPFENIGGDPEQDFFGTGIAGEILVSLAQIEALKVIGRTTAFSYKGQDDFKIIGKELDVNTILDGTVRKSGDQLRVTAQLTNVEDGAVLWANRFDRTYQDIFAIEDEIANEVVKGLKIELSIQEQRRLDKKYTENVEVYTLYLKAREEDSKSTAEGNENTNNLLSQILQIDPKYAPGLALYGFKIARSDGHDAGYKYINEALAIDPELGEAHNMKGLLQFYEWKFLDAEESLLKAISFGYTGSLGSLMTLYLNTGNYDRALETSKKLEQLDPALFERGKFWGSMLYLKTDKHAEALEIADEIAMEETHPGKLLFAGKVYLNLGQIDKAVYTLQKEANRGGTVQNQAIQAELGKAYYKKGDLVKSDSLLNVLKEKYQVPGFNGSAFYAAQIHSTREEVELAFEWLEKAYEAKEVEMIWLKIEPAFEPLYEDPRYLEMLDRVGFPKILRD